MLFERSTVTSPCRAVMPAAILPTSLLMPEEYVWLIGESYPSVPELSCAESLECLQMLLPEEVAPPIPAVGIVPLSSNNASEMVALTDLAFRSRTCEMGSDYGVRSEGELIAM